MKSGSNLIAEERLRQIEQECWTPDHDEDHDCNELAQAATCYIWAARELSLPKYERMDIDSPINAARNLGSSDWPTPLWPWDPMWWKPGNDPLRCLAKAGALIAAEIDRLIRRAADQAQKDHELNP